MTSPATPILRVPELGPALGRLVLPPGATAGTSPAPLATFDPVRIALVTSLFDRAGKARQALAEGDARGAVQALGPSAWRGLWEGAARDATAIVRARIDASLDAAAARSGYPLRRLARLHVSDDEAAGMALRLAAAGRPLAPALARLERAATDGAWDEALVAAARALESAWIGLEASAADEEAAWAPEAGRLEAWRPPRWPRRTAAAVVVAAALYAGLLLGGYLPVPRPLLPAANYWWSHLER